MRFTDDTEDSLAFVVALVNTASGASASGDDELSTVEQLEWLLDEHGYTGRRDGDDAELAAVQKARTLLRRFWSLNADKAAALVNDILTRRRAVVQLARHDNLDWHLHASDQEDALGERIQVDAAMAFVDVIRGSAMDQLRRCEADDCEGVFIDFSRNGSKRFCSLRCGNRMNVAAYRERQSEQTSE
ncbi:CGNR zinc finger domain-containing protein [Schumannella luteola]|uniref:Putative RNA-binding Zn ribbon-like protein n=1 Tax=Schumannella luteola TaxID=472059 RepID=A0A852YNT2_9MICO|nr:CGNR zinc finger domain-containing protein [Schumannella luteola]NYG99389.1 putative RNA-binding Zn ribbon-like protein [Schumannella luteola]TPX06114.1 RNA-binding protein [Schumannella luteola]